MVREPVPPEQSARRGNGATPWHMSARSKGSGRPPGFWRPNSFALAFDSGNFAIFAAKAVYPASQTILPAWVTTAGEEARDF